MGWVKGALLSVGMDKHVCLFALIRFWGGAVAERAGDGGTSVGNGSLTFRFSVSLKLLKKFFIFLYHRYNPCRRENILENRLEEPKLSHTFAVHKELRGYVCWSKSEKGIRCESGTIPVAVYLDFHSGSLCLLHSLPLAKAGKA